MAKTKKQRPTPKQQKFIDSYIAKGSVPQAYRDAGYSISNRKGTPQYAWHLFHSALVQDALDAVQNKRSRQAEYTLQSIREHHERLRELAEEKGDLAVATKNVELLGKTVGAYSADNVITIQEKSRLDEHDREKLKLIAETVLDKKLNRLPETTEDSAAIE